MSKRTATRFGNFRNPETILPEAWSGIWSIRRKNWQELKWKWNGSCLLLTFDYQLTTMPGIGIAVASKLVAEIGDIQRFRNADKLAKYSGVAPVKFSSAGKGKEQSSRQGNRKLHGLFYMLAVTMIAVPKSGRPNHPVFHRYYMRKISEGKTKSQALFCVMRRLVKIIYGMMRNKTEYREPVLENVLEEP